MLFTTAAVLLAGTQLAAAQAKIVPPDDSLAPAKEDEPQGWNPVLAGTATLNLVSNSSVVGQVEGTSMLLGLGVVGGADYVEKKHVVRTTLSINESVARTPVVDDFVKTNDVVQLEGLYNYFLHKKYGLFGRLALQTSLFAATDIRGEPTSWVRKDGVALNTNAFRQRLADPFKPMTLAESIGVFFDPKKSEKVSISLRLGLGARETFADGVLLIDDDKATPEIELLPLASAYQAGAEAFAGVTGKLKKGKMTYRAGLSALIPVLNNDDFDRGALDLARIGFEGNLTFNVYDWMSVVYTVTATRDPQLFPKGNELTQIQNNLLLTFKYALVEKRTKPKEPTAEEKAFAEEKARADAAETRVKQLETELGACTSQCPPTPAPAPEPAPEPTPAATP